MTDTPTKACSQCKKVLPLVAFPVARARPDGLAAACKVCLNTKAKIKRDAAMKARLAKKRVVTEVDRFPDRAKVEPDFAPRMAERVVCPRCQVINCDRHDAIRLTVGKITATTRMIV